MGGNHFMPRTKNEFYVWQSNFCPRISEKLGSFKIEESKFKPVLALQSKYELSRSRASNPDSANRADRVELKKRTAEYQAAIRTFINECIRFNSNVSEYDRQYLGLNIPDTTPTAAPVPTTCPVLTIDSSKTARHTLHIADLEKSGTGKPAGVKECEIWYQISDVAPAHFDDMRYAGSSSRASFVLVFDVPERGKRIWYNARWVSTRGEKGPWGEFAPGFIA